MSFSASLMSHTIIIRVYGV